MNFFILLSRWGLTRKSRSVIDKINDIVLGGGGQEISEYIHKQDYWN